MELAPKNAVLCANGADCYSRVLTIEFFLIELRRTQVVGTQESSSGVSNLERRDSA